LAADSKSAVDALKKYGKNVAVKNEIFTNITNNADFSGY